MAPASSSLPAHGAESRRLDPTAPMQIYFQGLLDGACFLYAQANAYKALTGKRVTREYWNRAISRLPDAAPFLGGEGAGKMGYAEAETLIEHILGAFSDPGETFAIERLSKSGGIAELCSEVSADSVVVFAYGGPTEFQHPESHVVCGVASEGRPQALQLACSAAFSGRHLKYGEYFERHHPDLNRWSNDSISVRSDVTVAPNFRWRVTLTGCA